MKVGKQRIKYIKNRIIIVKKAEFIIIGISLLILFFIENLPPNII